MSDEIRYLINLHNEGRISDSALDNALIMQVGQGQPPANPEPPKNTVLRETSPLEHPHDEDEEDLEDKDVPIIDIIEKVIDEVRELLYRKREVVRDQLWPDSTRDNIIDAFRKVLMRNLLENQDRHSLL